MTHPHRAPELRPPCAPATLRGPPARVAPDRERTGLVGRHPDEFLVTIRIKKHALADCLRRMPQHGTIHDSLHNAFSIGLLAAYELESEDRVRPDLSS